MFKHIVLMKIWQGANDEQKAFVVETFNLFPKRIPQIRRWSAGLKAMPACPYDYGYVAEFDSKEDYVKYYGPSDAHQEIVDTITKSRLVKDMVYVDIED